MSEPILRAIGLSKQFGTAAALVRAVDDVSLEAAPGELVLIMGPSGSGKTTLLSMLGALMKPDAGRIFIEDVEVSALREGQLPRLRANKIGFVFQSFNLLAALTVEENVLFPARLVAGGVKAAGARAEQLLERLELTGRRRALPRTLSGGEKQRVAIARALVNRPTIIFADEPTGNLDSRMGQEVMMILRSVARDQGCTVVMVTHDSRSEEAADRILWLEDGKLRDRKTDTHVWRRDPVCGMRVDEWTAVEKSRYRGRDYVFCSHECLSRFEASPAAYVLATGQE